MLWNLDLRLIPRHNMPHRCPAEMRGYEGGKLVTGRVERLSSNRRHGLDTEEGIRRPRGEFGALRLPPVPGPANNARIVSIDDFTGLRRLRFPAAERDKLLIPHRPCQPNRPGDRMQILTTAREE